LFYKKKSGKYFIFKNLDTNFLKYLDKIQFFFSKNFIPDFYKIIFEIKTEKNHFLKKFSKLKSSFFLKQKIQNLEKKIPEF